MSDDALTVTEAARLANTTIGDIYAAIQNGRLRTAPITTRAPHGGRGRGSSIGIIRASFDRWLEERKGKRHG